MARGLAGLTLSGGPNGAVWDGREAIVAGNLSLCPKLGSACEHTRPIVVAYNPATDRMRRLALPSVASNSAASLTPVARSGGAVIFRAWSASSLRVLDYRPATRRWQIGPTAPCTLSHGTDTQAVWAGDRLVVACAGDGLQVYDLAKASWRRLRPGPSQLNSRAASATTWTGRELIVWSGWAFERFDPTPADGSELLLPR